MKAPTGAESEPKRGSEMQELVPCFGTGESFAGKRVALLGELPTLDKKEAKRLLEAAGATVVNAVNLDTKFVVCGFDGGSKQAKAEELGIAVLDEAAMLAMIPDGLKEPKAAEPINKAKRGRTMDEQFIPKSGVNRERRTERACAQLLGLIAGITADGHLHDMEIQFLRTWLAEKQHEADHWLYDKLVKTIDHILSDGVITEAERAELMAELKAASGVDFADTGSVTPETMAFPADDGEVLLAGRNVCLTGKFHFGSRGDAAAATQAVGGICVDRVTKTTHYLVIGSAGATVSWKQATYGQKIDSAMKLKEQGHPILIVTEEQWTAGLAVAQV
ncbi:BRCT domain-containing protein [Comamonas fluminis]|uniref:BRCT domain-containing protein n=1 Tax=Comamonas fluminis TaxID=2796366 RepID=UPI001C4896E4